MVTNPEQERQRLSERYADMSLEKLHKIAADWNELTPIARETLEAEIQRRGSSIPKPIETKPAPPPPVVEVPVYEESVEDDEESSQAFEPDNSSGAKLVMVRSFRDLPEALLAKGSLDSAGIKTFLADDNIVRMDWFWSNLIGGVKLMVRPEDFSEATAILDQPIPEKFDGPDGEYLQPHCPQCGSLDVSFEELNKSIAFTSAYVHLPLPVHNQGWKCQTCEHRWDAPAEEGPRPGQS